MRPVAGAQRPSMSPQPSPSQTPSPQSAFVLHGFAPPASLGCSAMVELAGDPSADAPVGSGLTGFVASVEVGPTVHVATARIAKKRSIAGMLTLQGTNAESSRRKRR